MRPFQLSLLGLVFLASSGAAACDSGFAAFQTTVYAKVRRDCALCHDGTNRKLGAPPFATTDPTSSYNQLLSYMNFSNIPESLLVIRAGNGHCGKVNCQAPSGQEMATLAGQWWDNGEKACERNGHYFSSEIDVPADLPNVDVGFATLSFDLSAIKPELNGMSLEIEAQNFINKSADTKGMYRFRSPRLVGGKNSVYLKDIKILLNGTYDVINNAYTTIDRISPFFNLGTSGLSATPVLSGETLLILKDGLANPKVSVSFVDIGAKSDAAACANMSGFASRVQPLLATYNCASCHQSKGVSIGERLFDCTAPAAGQCQVASALIDPQYFMVSPLITFPSQGLYNHPVLTDTQRYDYVKALKTWLNQ